MANHTYSRTVATVTDIRITKKLLDTGHHGTFLIVHPDDLDKVLIEKTEPELWAFRPSFLASCTGLDFRVFEALAAALEDSQDAVKALVEATCGIEELVQAAVASDGTGHLLASYDSEEVEVKLGKTTWLAYRQE